MINILVGLIVLAWFGGAAFYIIKRKLAAKKSGKAGCIGCSCGCGCGGCK